MPDTVGGETLYYLELDITNVSAPATGGDHDPNTSFQLGLMQTGGEPASMIINSVAFEACDEEMPSDLAVGETYRTGRRPSVMRSFRGRRRTLTEAA